MKSFALAALALLLGACQSLSPASRPAVYQRTAWEHQQPGCQGSDCPLVNIDTVNFPDEPELNRLIDRGLLELIRESEGMPLPASLQSHERDFLAGARPGWSSYLQAKVLEQNGGRILVELSSYRFTGGAHGMPRRAFIDFDRGRQKALELRDLLLPGQEEAFWTKAEQAHQRWLAAQGVGEDAEFIATWPFQQTQHIALAKVGVLLMYDTYRIAPYAMGHPLVVVPYPQLNGILKPELFPRGK
ncbi:DUF3298 and DUF4163 domain-containing protein [Azorhizophilus paspali]|uniref:DUF3298 domain-containing protein n=1 Tax=Azorhizophilus paspali TaxID=69963 RepID=A0ABV6SID8_AZOPA